MIKSSQGDSKSSKSISRGHSPATVDHSSSQLGQVDHLELLLLIWVCQVEVSSASLSEIGLGSLLLEVDITIVTGDSLGLISSLSETRGTSEWIGTNSSGHVVVLALKLMGPESHWLLLCVVTFWDSLPELLIWALLKPSPGSMLNNELLVLFVEGHLLSIGVLHHSSSDSVLLVIQWLIGAAGGGLEVPALALSLPLGLSILDLLSNFHGDLKK